MEEKLSSPPCAPQIHHNRVRVHAIGRLDLLPPTTREAIRAAADTAVRALLAERHALGATLPEAIAGVTPEAISRHLYLGGIPEPELIIWTSGEARGFPASCSGKAPIASIISPMCSGRNTVSSTSCGRFVRSSTARAGSVAEFIRKAEPPSRRCNRLTLSLEGFDRLHASADNYRNYFFGALPNRASAIGIAATVRKRGQNRRSTE